MRYPETPLRCTSCGAPHLNASGLCEDCANELHPCDDLATFNVPLAPWTPRERCAAVRFTGRVIDVVGVEIRGAA